MYDDLMTHDFYETNSQHKERGKEEANNEIINLLAPSLT
jgi:hypothetical protein